LATALPIGAWFESVKLGCKQLMKSFKHHWFGGKALTKAKIEAFFDDAANFEKP
tara:strand:- start:435 stop:596 length:162 start_codon:yes stop_codon:yes gene_type:complete